MASSRLLGGFLAPHGRCMPWQLKLQQSSEGTAITPAVVWSRVGGVADSGIWAVSDLRRAASAATSHPAPGCRLNIPDYFTIISHPMDLATIAKKLENNPRRNIVRRYQTPLEFRDDVRLVGAGKSDWGPCAGAWPPAYFCTRHSA